MHFEFKLATHLCVSCSQMPHLTPFQFTIFENWDLFILIEALDE